MRSSCATSLHASEDRDGFSSCDTSVPGLSVLREDELDLTCENNATGHSVLRVPKLKLSCSRKYRNVSDEATETFAQVAMLRIPLKPLLLSPAFGFLTGLQGRAHTSVMLISPTNRFHLSDGYNTPITKSNKSNTKKPSICNPTSEK